jgi:predicted DNA-binding transcriptional regulator AlpA
MDDLKLIPLAEAMQKFNLARATIDRKCKAGVFQKYTLPGSSKVYLSENEILNAFQPKTE